MRDSVRLMGIIVDDLHKTTRFFVYSTMMGESLYFDHTIERTEVFDVEIFHEFATDLLKNCITSSDFPYCRVVQNMLK